MSGWISTQACPPDLSPRTACAAQLPDSVSTGIAEPHPPLSSDPFQQVEHFFGSRIVTQEMEASINLARGRMKLAPCQSALLRVSHSGMGCKEGLLPQGCAGGYGTHPVESTCADHGASLHWERAQHTSMVLGRGKCTVSALESQVCWADEWWPFCMLRVSSTASVVLGTQIFFCCACAKSVTELSSCAGVFWLKRLHLMSA